MTFLNGNNQPLAYLIRESMLNTLVLSTGQSKGNGGGETSPIDWSGTDLAKLNRWSGLGPA